MFNRHEFRVKMVKTPKDENESTPTLAEVLNEDSVQLIEEAGKRLMKHTAIMVAATAIAIKVVDHFGDIIVDRATR